MNNDINSKQIQELIDIASKKSGMDKKKLQSLADGGSLNDVLSSLKPQDAQKIQKILSDKDAAEKLLSTPQAEALLKKLKESK